eukprot:403347881
MARFYPKDFTKILIWENHSFPTDVQVFNIKEQGEPERDMIFEEKMRLTKSVLSLREVATGVGLKTIEQISLEERIIGVRINQDGSDGIVVCKRIGYRNVDILKISDSSYYKSLRFTNKNTENLKVKISQNLEKILLNNDTDNILYQNDRQEVLGWFKRQTVHKIACTQDNNFIAICSNPYDVKINLYRSDSSENYHTLSLKTSPKIFKYYDMKCDGDMTYAICLRDTEIFVDFMKQGEQRYTQYYYSYYLLEEFKWPYVSFIVNTEDIFIINAFAPKKAKRISYKDSDESVVSSFISKSMNMFYMTYHRKNKTYHMHMLDLDKTNLNKRVIFQTSSDTFNSQALYQMHVRSTSEKERNDYNLKTIAFLRFSDDLYAWTEVDGIKHISKVNFLKSIEDDKIFILDKSQRINKWVLPYYRPEPISSTNSEIIYCLNPYECRYFIYNLKGQVINRVTFDDVQAQYGDPVCVSHNGMKYLLKAHSWTKLSLFEMQFQSFKKLADIDLNKIINDDPMTRSFLENLNAHLFFWNGEQIHYYDFYTNTYNQINLQVPIDQLAQVFIKAIRVSGNQDNQIAITLQLSEQIDTVMIYDVQAQVEIDSFDVHPTAEKFFDKEGNLYILNQDEITIGSMNLKTLSYNIDISEFDKQYLYFGLDKGCRVNSQTMDFILIRNYIGLGQSYLQLIAREDLQFSYYSEENMNVEMSLSIQNKQTELHQNANEYQNINYLLSKYEQTDPRLLEQLLIINQNGKTPIHLALENNDHKCISSLLKYMSKIESSNSKNFKDVFRRLLQYDAFQAYLDNCFFKTIQMKNLHTLPIYHNSQEFEIAIGHHTSYLDHQFFSSILPSASAQESFHLKQSTKHDFDQNQPVTLKGLNVHWFFNSAEGLKFLLKISNHKNLKLFDTQSIKIIIQYLWSYYQGKIIWYTLLPYLFYHATFLLLVFYNERYFIGDNLIEYEDGERAVAMCFSERQVSNIRRIESVASTLMWLKFLYFFRIIDTTAPLIRMIKEIMIDMTSFIFIFVISLLAFANGFYLLAQNQLYQGQDKSQVSYWNVLGAIRYVYLASIGEFDHSSFDEVKEEHLLWIYLVITTIFQLIVLLNMLIAIMSQTFGRVAETAKPSIQRERLQLIIENWFLPQINNIDKVKYLISIQSNTGAESSEEIISNIASQLNETTAYLKQSLDKIQQKLDN